MIIIKKKKTRNKKDETINVKRISISISRARDVRFK